MKGNYHFSVVVAMVAAFCVPSSCQQAQQPSQQQQPQQSNKCSEGILVLLQNCLKEAGLTYGNFLWFVTNGTSPKSEPPASPDAYTPQICKAQQQVGGCTFQQIGPIINSSACIGTSSSTSQQGAVMNQLTVLFNGYDEKCMNPCRRTLPNDLRTCYTDSGLDPKLFLSNSTNGAVIGSTKEQVATFCGVKDALIKCLQTKVDACPEAPQILRAIDLDIPSFQKGVAVLCAHPDVYLHGLNCFAETTPEIDRCKQKETQSFIQLDTQARAGNWSEQKFYLEYCEITITQIACDLNAWGNKNHVACSDAVIGLRRELECGLVNSQCKVDPKQISEVEHACHPEKFSTKARKDFSKGSATLSALASTGLLIVSLGLSGSWVL